MLDKNGVIFNVLSTRKLTMGLRTAFCGKITAFFNKIA